MVMSAESVVQEEIGEEMSDDNKDISDKVRVTDREKELAAEASAAYNSGDFSACLESLEKLEVKVIHILNFAKILKYFIVDFTTYRFSVSSQQSCCSV